MTKNARRALFYGLVALFLIAGTAVVLYAQGWRLDLTTGRVSKIGAIYVRSYPENAGLSLNGKPIENTSGFLNPGTLISDLFPKTYALSLAEPGYEAWRENVTVEPSLVVLLKYAVLVPQNAAAVASGSVSGFLVSDDGTIILQNLRDMLSTSGNPIGEGTIVGATASQEGLIFQEADGSYHFFDAKTDAAADLSSFLSENGIPSKEVTSLTFDPDNADVIVIAKQNALWLDESGSLTQIERAPGTSTISPSAAISDPLIAWTQFEKVPDTSRLVLYDRNAGSLLGESSTTFAGTTRQLAWISGGTLGILQSDGSLYLYEASGGTAKKIADDVRSFAASDDGTMIAALEQQGMEIFSPQDASVYYRFNLPDIGDVQKLIWYRDDSHLFVVYPDHISFLDLADTGLTNFATVAEGTAPHYDESSNSLYFISPTSQLLQLAFPN